jgi:aminopeptidase N
MKETRGLHPTRSLICTAVACLLAASVAQARGESTDPFFPRSGNRGYDVLHYDARLSYAPRGGELRGAATITATASQPLRRFSLDLYGLRVTGVSVEGERARVSRGPGKLKVTPAAPLESGRSFVAVVRYRGRPRTIVDADGAKEGWLRTRDGAAALGEPVGTASWLPCNNTLTDKASFSFHITVPGELKAVANGRLVSVRRQGGSRTFAWRESEPMATYLATVDIGQGRLVHREIAGLPAWTLVDPRAARGSRRALGALPQIVRFESRIFGPYPFDALGSVVDPLPVLYALETQTRPTYTFPPGRVIVVHEMAHQWFGDSVGLTRWPEIWLNEGFATWAEWYYAERHGGRGAQRTFERFYRTPALFKGFWDPPSGHPGTPRHLFGTSVYLRGGMTLQALRGTIGTKALLTILRRWTAEHRHGNATIRQFITLAEQVSGRDLDQFFDDWLYKRGKPRGYD